VKHVFAGTDGSLLLTITGRVLATGSNEFNKLGFNSETSGLKKHKPKVSTDFRMPLIIFEFLCPINILLHFYINTCNL